MNAGFFFLSWIYIFFENFIPAKIKSLLISQSAAILSSLTPVKLQFKYQILKKKKKIHPAITRFVIAIKDI